MSRTRVLTIVAYLAALAAVLVFNYAASRLSRTDEERDAEDREDR